MKKFLSVALAVIMLLAAVPTVALAVTYISKVEIDFVSPVAGEPAFTDSIIDGACGYQLKEARWLDADSDVYLTADDVFDKGDYILEATFEAESGYKFKSADNVEVIINGMEADEVVKNADGTLTASVTFTSTSSGKILPAITNLLHVITTVFSTFVRFIGSLLGL